MGKRRKQLDAITKAVSPPPTLWELACFHIRGGLRDWLNAPTALERRYIDAFIAKAHADPADLESRPAAPESCASDRPVGRAGILP